MTSCSFAHLLVCFLAYADFTHSEVHYYITPSPNASCPQGPCLTISQLTSDSSSNETNVSLFFLPGNHILDLELSLPHADNFSMTKEAQDNESVFIKCMSQSGRFILNETTFALVKGLHFIGCGGNTVTQVKQFILEDTIFHGMEGGDMALVLNEVADVSIVRSSFLSNSYGRYKDHSEFSGLEHVLSYLSLEWSAQPSETVLASGALYVAFSNVWIDGTNFDRNRAELLGAAVTVVVSNVSITNSLFTYNNIAGDDLSGFSDSYGVILSYESDVSIDSSKFVHNTAARGGVLFAHNSSLHVTGSTFTSNSAATAGGVMHIDESLFDIINSTFTDNSAEFSGGVLLAVGTSFNIINSTFTNNSAAYAGGVMAASESSFTVTSSTFTNSSTTLTDGVMTIQHSSFNITNSSFSRNTATDDCGVMTTFNSLFNITNSTFIDNSARVGGVICTYSESSFMNITSSTFTNNVAAVSSGVIYTWRASFNITNSTFINNTAYHYGGVMVIFGGSSHIVNGTFDHNLGSLYTFSSNLTFSGYTRFENCMEPRKNEGVLTRQEGGAITSYQSSVLITGVSAFLNNQARHGGAIFTTESIIMMYGEATIGTNVATGGSGGGIYLHQSDLEIKGSCSFFHNHAVWGGGIHASSSSISVNQQGALQFINNTAENGGGIYLEINPRIYLLKSEPLFSWNEDKYLLTFTGNHANYGGAVYVADDKNSAVCTSSTECFIQSLSLHQQAGSLLNVRNVIFSENTATERGSNLFGGLLDRCSPSPFAEVYQKLNTQYNGITYLGNISDIMLDSMASLPVQACFCNSEGHPDCNYQLPPIKVKKGQAFTVPLVAVDQVKYSVDANITSILISPSGGIGEGQQTQKVKRNCTDLTFNVFSPDKYETIVLFAAGPCGSSTFSIRHVNIQFLDCTCPIGFEPSKSKKTDCECVCHSALSPYVTDCDHTTNSLLRATNSWITYINDTHPLGYVIHPHCPLDYCHPPSENVSINLNLPNGVDTQCAYNRRGVLCGACQENLSLSLGSSQCLPCNSHWPAVLVAILLAAIIAGILLVATLFVLNMTVAVGLINGFIIYANIVAASSSVFFPSSEPSFPTVFVAWLNLDIGIDVCFFDGLDAYTKTWLQLTFSLYIISLVVMVIIVSECSPRFAGLIGKRDPIATLATLILLSYSKLLSITIAALSFAVLHYPDGSQEMVWLPDGNVKYFQGKHIALVIVTLFIVLIGVPYTILLFLWQWLVQAPKWKVFKWTRNTKLNAFIATYHAPYNSKYRFWTGLLLLVRVILYITAAVTVSNNPQTYLLVTSILVGGLFLLKGIIGVKVYKKSPMNIIETVIYFNLLALAVFSLYDFKTDIRKQTAIAYVFTTTTFILLVGVVIYHVTLLIKKDKTSEEVNEYPLPPVQSANSEVTHSVVEILNPQRSSCTGN